MHEHVPVWIEWAISSRDPVIWTESNTQFGRLEAIYARKEGKDDGVVVAVFVASSGAVP
jgi:hypothetical protein